MSRRPNKRLWAQKPDKPAPLNTRHWLYPYLKIVTFPGIGQYGNLINDGFVFDTSIGSVGGINGNRIRRFDGTTNAVDRGTFNQSVINGAGFIARIAPNAPINGSATKVGLTFNSLTCGVDHTVANPWQWSTHVKAGGSWNAVKYGTPPGVGEMATVAGVWDDINQQISSYQGGQLTGASSGLGNYDFASRSAVTIGSGVDNSNNNYYWTQMDVDFVLYFEGIVPTDAQIESLSNSPLQLLQPRTIWVPVGVAGGQQTITPSAITSTEVFGAQNVMPGAITLQPNNIASTEAIGSPDLFNAAVIITQTIASLESVPTPALFSGAATVQPNAINSDEVIGSCIFSTGSVSITPNPIISNESFGSATITIGAISLLPSSIISAESVGSPQIITDSLLLPYGIASAEAAGVLNVQPGAVNIDVAGIDSGEAFGTQIVHPGSVIIVPDSVVSAELFGGALVIPDATVITPSSITSNEQFGTIVILGGVEFIGWLLGEITAYPALTGKIITSPATDH